MATTTQQAKTGRTRSSGTQRSGAASRKTSGTSRTSQARTESAAKQTRQSDSHGTTVHLPFVTAEFHRPDLHLPSVPMPDVRENVAGMVDTVRSTMPSREEMAYFGGLGLLAALSVIEWPVAAAIGVGTVIAQRASSAHQGAGRSKS